ncbi:MAG: hypothetical protein F6K30_12735 [Cyanothece sp. SIO2G6]|nr:hypothetical protein [Cyanothece sp. SIO2G6]
MRDYWIDGLLAITTIGSLYWTLTQMVQQPSLGIGPLSDGDQCSERITPERAASERAASKKAIMELGTATATVSTESTIRLGSDQPVDEDPDFDIDMDDLGAIATFENQRL